MGRRIVPLTADTVGDLPTPCRDCPFWETSPAQHDGRASAADGHRVKRTWLEATTAAWGPCGLLAHVDDVPAGFVTYAPPAFVPRASAFPTAPVSSDAVLLMTARVADGQTGAGLGRALVQAAAKDLGKRGVRAIEAYGAVGELCLLSAEFLESVGFVTVRDHARHPRLRLDLRAAVTWREPVEEALGRFRRAVRPFPAGANRT
jgi:hypothetical protein